MSGTITWVYDTVSGGHHPRVQETTTPGTVTVEYNEIGRRLKLSATGQTDTTYTYDKNSRLKTVTKGTQTVTLTYDDAGRRTSLSYPNGVATSYGYDNANRLLTIGHVKTPTTIESLTYTYDKGGNRITQVRQNAMAANLPTAVTATNIGYDAANELTRWNSATTNLTYDNNGNLATETQVGVTTTYTWDGRNRLTGINRAGITASFLYDGLGRRKSKTINGTTTGFWYEGNDVYAELTGATPSATYIRGLSLDEPYIRKGASDEFYETDALGSSLVLTNSAGASQTTYTYEPFGSTTQAGSASSNAFQYTGRENDGTGLYYYRARYYGPMTQRFATEDPIELAGGDINQYAFVRNSPCNYIDPLGLEKKKPSCFSRNRFANLFDGTGFEDVITAFEMVSLASVASDLVAVGAKSMRVGVGGTTQRYASGLNYVFRQVGRAVGSTALTGSLIAFGNKVTPALAVSGAFMGAYDATIFTQCLLGVLE